MLRGADETGTLDLNGVRPMNFKGKALSGAMVALLASTAIVRADDMAALEAAAK